MLARWLAATFVESNGAPPTQRIIGRIARADYAVVTAATLAAPASKRPLSHPQQLRRLQLAQLARLIPIHNTPQLQHSHTLKNFRPPHSHPPFRGKRFTGQIVCYLNRTYPVLPTRRHDRP